MIHHPPQCLACLRKILEAVLGARLKMRVDRRMMDDLLAGLFPSEPDPTTRILTISIPRPTLIPIPTKQSAEERRHPNQPFYARFRKERRRGF